MSVALDKSLPATAGWMLQPAMGNHPLGGRPWAADNGCFAAKTFDASTWLAWLDVRRTYQETCLFAVVPDVVADATATLERFGVYAEAVRALGYRVALVAQDGLESLAVPWSEFDCLFIGGSTAWKLSEPAYRLMAETKIHGKWTHVGRVNSERRIRAMAMAGADSVDGTYLAFGPDVNGPRLVRWLTMTEQPRLWAVT